MLYNYIKTHYKQAEPIFLSDLLRTNITEPDLNQQLKELCEKGLLQQYDEEVYFIPKKTTLNSIIGPRQLHPIRQTILMHILWNTESLRTMDNTV